MIQEFIDIFIKHKGELEEKYRNNLPSDYEDIVKDVVKLLYKHGDNTYPCPDPETVHGKAYGYCQGTLIFIMADNDDCPMNFWSVFIEYGTCGACDAFYSAIEDYRGEDRIEALMLLALHVVERIRNLYGGLA